MACIGACAVPAGWLHGHAQDDGRIEQAKLSHLLIIALDLVVGKGGGPGRRIACRLAGRTWGRRLGHR